MVAVVNIQLNSFFLAADEKKSPMVDMREVEKIKKLLRKADKDKNGCYNRDELKNALKDLGAYFPAWRTNRCFANVDSDNDGQISGHEIDHLIDYLLSCGYGK
ncbi:hypothetical protein VNO78_28797 [Psophocarpus tetragonolobus]|uniref:EF-hand domain-containing protein n=1 Tax=Psophocarpus tetragonolobus TaxID=3891 RepID=A0AAN9RUA8_PSOTE